MSGWNIPPPPPPTGQGQVPRTIFDDIERIKGMVGRYFPIYNIEVHFDTVSLKCNVDPRTLEERFESLRRDMKAIHYIPLITKDRGEYLIHVVRAPRLRTRGIWLNIILLLSAIGTTIMAGAALWSATFATGGMWLAVNVANGALYFALPLMLILGVHEMGHYFAARRHGVAASLPFFIPAPSILGTFGAFISIREPIPSKKALLDIGIAGPVAGFLVAVPVLALGLHMSAGLGGAAAAGGTIQGGTMLIGTSVIFQGFTEAFGLPAWATIHPLAFAGWVGFFVTALNLLPAGQLDGGHIARALLGERARWAGYGALGLMLLLGLFYSGWLIFALLIMFLGLRHPPPLNSVTKLDGRRKVLGAAAVVMLVLCFVPIPISQVPVNYDFTFQEADGTPAGPYFSHSIDKALYDDWQNTTFPFRIVSSGNMPLDLSFRITVETNGSGPVNCTAWLSENGAQSPAPPENYTGFFNTTLDIGQTLNLTLHMTFPPVTNATEFTIDIEETAYDWESPALASDSGHSAHGMKVRVMFS